MNDHWLRNGGVHRTKLQRSTNTEPRPYENLPHNLHQLNAPTSIVEGICLPKLQHNCDEPKITSLPSEQSFNVYPHKS